jgi:hypothetical protein
VLALQGIFVYTKENCRKEGYYGFSESSVEEEIHQKRPDDRFDHPCGDSFADPDLLMLERKRRKWYINGM